MIEQHLGVKPFFDRNLLSLVDQKDCMYVHNDFVHPGYHNYYIIVPNGIGGFSYKKHFITFVKPRNEDIPLRPLLRAIEGDDQESEDDNLSKSVIGKEWKFENKGNLEILFTVDFEKWKLPEELVSPEDIEFYKTCFRNNLQYFFALHRKLSIESDIYPLLNYKVIE